MINLEELGITPRDEKYARFQVKRDTSDNWTQFNPILFEGEFGFETDTGRFKIGKRENDKLLNWNELKYASGADLGDFSLETKKYNDTNFLEIKHQGETIGILSAVDNNEDVPQINWYGQIHTSYDIYSNYGYTFDYNKSYFSDSGLYLYNREDVNTVQIDNCDGTAWFKSGVTIGDENNQKTLATEEYIDNKIDIGEHYFTQENDSTVALEYIEKIEIKPGEFEEYIEHSNLHIGALQCDYRIYTPYDIESGYGFISKNYSYNKGIYLDYNGIHMYDLDENGVNNVLIDNDGTAYFASSVSTDTIYGNSIQKVEDGEYYEVATQNYVDEALSNVNVDLSGYATTNYVDTQIQTLIDTIEGGSY